MPFCKVSQAELYYEEKGSGRPIVMIHGFTPDHRLMSGCMEPVFEKREGWRRIYLDLPGMGRSRNYADIESTDGMLDAVLELIDKLIPESNFAVAGESYGGYLTRGIIARRSQRVEGAALICPMVVPDKERALPPHTVFYEDPMLIAELQPEEYADFRSMGVVLDRRAWERYAEEIVPGCRLADAAFWTRFGSGMGFLFPSIRRRLQLLRYSCSASRMRRLGMPMRFNYWSSIHAVRLPSWIGRDTTYRSIRKMRLTCW